MPSRNGDNQGSRCCSCISLAISATLFWLFQFKTSSPTCSIEAFDVFAPNTTIHYDLKLKNKDSNVNKGIYYDALNLTFYYKQPNLNGFEFPLGNSTFSPFYQGRRKATHRVGSIEPRGVRWENATVPVVFRVELATAVRYKNTFWKTKRHHLVVGVDLKVNERGSLLKEKDNKGIKLGSKAGNNNNKGHFKLMGIFGILIFIHSM